MDDAIYSTVDLAPPRTTPIHDRVVDTPGYTEVHFDPKIRVRGEREKREGEWSLGTGVSMPLFNSLSPHFSIPLSFRSFSPSLPFLPPSLNPLSPLLPLLPLSLSHVRCNNRELVTVKTDWALHHAVLV